MEPGFEFAFPQCDGLAVLQPAGLGSAHLSNPQTMDLSCCLAQTSMQHPAVFSVSMAMREKGLVNDFAVCPMELTGFNGQKRLCVKVSNLYFTDCPVFTLCRLLFTSEFTALSQRATSVSQIPANTMVHVHLVDLQHSPVTVKALGSQDQLATLELSPPP